MLMRLTQLLQILFILIASLFFRNAKAADIVGGSLRYEALGGQKYKVIGTIIRNCGGDPLDIPIIKVFDKCVGKSISLAVNRTSIKNITNFCSGTSSPCLPQNTKGTEGQEEHTFEATIDFNVSPYITFKINNQCMTFFSMETCCRSGNIANTTSDSFYIESMVWLYHLIHLGSTTTVNTTPEIYLPEFISTCKGSPFQYNTYGEDKDKDSLAFNIIPPRKSSKSFASFITPYDLHHPIAYDSVSNQPKSFIFDSTSGNMFFTPIDTTNGAIITLQIDEYRKLGLDKTMTQIGFSTREIYVQIKNCKGNNPPQIPTSSKYTVCEGNKLCFTIQSKDSKSMNQSSDDTTFLAWNNGIPAGVFKINDPTAREKQAEFCWQTKTGDSRNEPYRLIVTAKDNSCTPNPVQINKGFEIIVKPKAIAKRTYANLTDKTLLFEANSTNSNQSLSYEWQVRISSNNTLIYTSYKQKDSFTFNAPGTYYITCIANKIPMNCPSTSIDTVTMNFNPSGISKNTIYEGISVYPNPGNGNLTIEVPAYPVWETITLTDVTGKTVYSSAYKHRIDISHLPNGIYLLSLQSEGKRHQVKVVKE